MLRTIAVLLCLFSAPGAFASGEASGEDAPETPVLIVDRRPQSIALFFTLPAIELQTVFGLGAEGLLGADGTIDIDRLYEGTFDLADQIFRQVQAEIAGRPVAFDATSMMVHDPAALPSFENPWDGETSIAVCTSPETVDNMGLETLQAYLGYFAWKVDPLAPVTLKFPAASDNEINIEVRDFWNMQLTATRTMTLAGDRTLVLEPGRSGGLGPATLGLLAAALLGVGILLLVLHRREGAGLKANSDGY